MNFNPFNHRLGGASKLSINKFLLIFVIFYLISATVVSAAGLVPCGPGGSASEKACKFCDLFVLIKNVIDFAFKIAMVLGTIFIIYGGFVILTAGGSPERVKSGRSAILAAIVGVIIALGAWLIIDTILKVLTDGTFGPWNKLPC